MRFVKTIIFSFVFLIALASQCSGSWERFKTAATENDTFQINEMIKSGFDVNASGKFGATALIIAIQNKNFEVTKILLENGADPNKSDEAGVAPIHFAAKVNKVDILKILLENGANVNAKTSFEFTPVMYAALHGNKENVQLLLSSGAKTNVESFEKRTALEYAIQSKNPEVVEVFRGKIEDMTDVQMFRAKEYASGGIGVSDISSRVDIVTSPVNKKDAKLIAKNKDVDLGNKVDIDTNRVYLHNINKDKVQQENRVNSNVRSRDNVRRDVESSKNDLNIPGVANIVEKRTGCYGVYLGTFNKTASAKKNWADIAQKHGWIRSMKQLIEISLEAGVSGNSVTMYKSIIGSSCDKKEADVLNDILNKYEMNTSVVELSSMQYTNGKEISETVKNLKEYVKKKQADEKDKLQKDKLQKDKLKKDNNKSDDVKKAVNKESDNGNSDGSDKNDKDLTYYYMNFGIFIDEKHAHNYWNGLQSIPFMKVFSNPILTKMIMDKISKPVLEMTSGATTDYKLAMIIVDILRNHGVRVMIQHTKSLPEGMRQVEKEDLIALTKEGEILQNTIIDKNKFVQNNQNHLKFEVKEAVHVPENYVKSVKKNLNEESLIMLKIGEFNERYQAHKIIKKSIKEFKVTEYSIRSDIRNKLFVNIVLADNRTNKGEICEFFIEQGYSCAKFY